MSQIFHPLLAMIASATDRALANYVEFLKNENRSCELAFVAMCTHTPEEREVLLTYGKPLGRAIEELITIVTPYRWVREEG